MFDLLKSLFPRNTKRHFDAAGGGRRWQGAATIGNINSSILTGSATISRRADYYVHNNPHAKAGVSALVANMVGTGIKPQSQHPSAKFRETIHRQWLTWTDCADADGLTDFYGFQALVAQTMIVHGECFVRLLARRVKGKIIPQLQLIHPDQVDRGMSRDLAERRRVIGGIEFDSSGQRLAYHVFKQRSGDLGSTSLETVRVPASEMIHVFAPITPGQVRGVSWLSPVLLRLHEIDGLEDAQLVRQRIAAMFAGFITDLEGGTGGFEGTPSGNVLETGMEPGTLKLLPPGTDIKFSNPAEVGDTAEFLKLQLRAVASGLGVTYEQLTGDLSGVNYSSIRAGLVEFRRRIEAVQHHVLVFQFCRPVWARFIRMQVLSGVLRAPHFERDEAIYLSAKWIAPGWAWVDPLKDAQAAITEIEAGIRSRSEVVNGRGYDVEALDAEIAADKKRAERLGLRFSTSSEKEVNHAATNTH